MRAVYSYAWVRVRLFPRRAREACAPFNVPVSACARMAQKEPVCEMDWHPGPQVSSLPPAGL